MRSSWITQLGPKSSGQCLDKSEKSRTEGHVKTEAETGMMGLQARDPHGWPAAAGSQEGGLEEILPQSLQKQPTLQTY